MSAWLDSPGFREAVAHVIADAGTPANDGFLDAEGAAAYLGLPSRKALYHLVERRRIRPPTGTAPPFGGRPDDGLGLERDVAFDIPGLRPVSLEVEMTAEEFELLSADDAEALLAERFTRLTAAGYPPTSALIAAAHVEVDIEVAERLVHDAQPWFSVCTIF